jgi:hypothetical protein
VTVTSAGSVLAEGPIVVKDELPAGVDPAAEGVSLVLSKPYATELPPAGEEEGVGTCEEAGEPESGVTVTCTDPNALEPDQNLGITMFVTVDEAVAESGTLNRATVVGSAKEAGESPPEAAESEPLTLGSELVAFGPSDLVSYTAALDGGPDTQAGDHPYEMVTRFDLKSAHRYVGKSNFPNPTSVDDVKDVVVDLPVGITGDAQATPKCTFAQLATRARCPADTQIGELQTQPGGLEGTYGPIYNMVPEHGVAAEFGFFDAIEQTHAIYASVVPTPSGYTLRATSPEVPEIALTSVIATIYGNPVAKQEEIAKLAGKKPSAATQVAALTNSSDCSSEEQARVSTVHLDSWVQPGPFSSNGTPSGEPEFLPGSSWTAATSSAQESPPLTGCNELRLTPGRFSAQPDTNTADSPTGLTINEQIPQDEQPGALATPALKEETVTLPAGLIPNPAAASGLVGCSETQIGWLHGTLSNFTAAPPACPEASKLGSVEVVTPLLEKPLDGVLYLAKQDANPFNSILAGYIVIDDPTTGIIVKVPGKLTLNPTTGQITGDFEESPQIGVFSELKLRFSGGERGELATPESCGTYTTAGQMTPWSARGSGPPADVSDSFQINSGCLPEFAPSFAAGTTSPQAGGYSPFALSFSRQDNEQEISGLTVSLPPGLSAKIAGVGKCTEAQLQAAASNPLGMAEIANPSCPASSEVGTVEAAAGAGGEPFYLSGKAYLTGPYKGAPLGLAVIVPAVAGPFDLGNVVVRTALYINRNDAQVTAVSDPLPTIIDATGGDGHTDGFPDRMRSIDVTLNRNTYILNPTNCSPMSINATLTSTGGLTSTGSSRFQAGGCRELAFKPSFTVSTQGHASKAAGASLHVHVTSTPGQANIAKVHTELPKQLPSWLPTLQKACLAATFEANPASCPAGSLVGTATATTPLLATPFTGPAYLVSHGSAAFPDLEIVLQAEDITIVLDGKTDIKHGITISNFETVPDQPVTSFELSLPMGPNHVLATDVPEKLNHNLCGQTLKMPTIITGQNGAVIKQTTKISITGCAKAKAKKKKKKKKAKKAAHHKKK